jgi:hypothetical protein
MNPETEKIYKKHESKYREAMRRVVCEHCIDFAEDGSCKTHDADGCAVFRYLPELVQIALTLHERKVEPYVEAVRKHLCTSCRDSAGTGQCELRENLDCGLNRYLPMVLEAIEEVNLKLGL